MAMLLRSQLFLVQSRPTLGSISTYRRLTTASGVHTDGESELYKKSCERNKEIQQQWLKSSVSRLASGPYSNESSSKADENGSSYYLPMVNKWLGRYKMNILAEALLAAKKFSKYAWIPCNHGAKFALMAGDFYFSIDETSAYSNIYLVSVAKRKALAKIKEERSNAAKTSTYIFPYHPRRIILHADSFQEAIHLADALVEKMVRGEKLRLTFPVDPFSLPSLQRFAPWRNEPSTAAQLSILLRLGSNCREPDLFKVALSMQKGDVAALITDTTMNFEKAPLLSRGAEEEDHPVVQEFDAMTDSHANFVMSNGLWDLES
ncbi:hypothetical protein QFC19_004618 [Naganishia cerealis]|uniref:Uncharacterized protein n=1 Tax=Naganishia cerealis TaxID=610337 RepID=A0ACC2VUT1_9TREE|nr:hypothetical protein QFC19_004618 [Naganishia cerealis]